MDERQLTVRKLTTTELVAARQTGALAAAPRFPIYVVCDNVRSLANVGLIFRLSDAARVAHLFLCGITGYPPLHENDPRPPHVAARAGREIGKTAIRTVSYVPWSYHDQAATVARELKAAGAQIVALEQTTQSVHFADARYTFPVCLLLGHEREGLGSSALSLADLIVEIPMYGAGNSLNVAQACGIALYQFVRRYTEGRRA